MWWMNNLVPSRLPKHSFHLHLISFMCLIFFAIFNEKSHTNNMTFSSICLNLTDTVSLQNLRQLKVKANILLRKYILHLVQMNLNIMCTARGKKFNKLSTLGGRLQISKFFRWRVFKWLSSAHATSTASKLTESRFSKMIDQKHDLIQMVYCAIVSYDSATQLSFTNLFPLA